MNNETLRIAWEPAPGGSRKGMVADISGFGRLYVARSGKGSRMFDGKINGKLVGTWDNIERAMSETAKAARVRAGERGPVAC